MTCKYFSFLHGLLNSEICCHMKNFCCLLVNQFQVPAKHFFLKTIYLGVAKGLQFSWKANRKKSHTHRKGSMGQCSVNNYFCEAKPVATALFDENMKEHRNRWEYRDRAVFIFIYSSACSHNQVFFLFPLPMVVEAPPAMTVTGWYLAFLNNTYIWKSNRSYCPQMTTVHLLPIQKDLL